MAQQPIIQFFNITKIFGKNVVLDNLNLDISYGEIFGIIGRSGSGKTTLLSALVGFIKPEKGKIFFQEQNITNNIPDSVKQQIGFTAQEGSYYPRLTVRENLEYFGTLYNLSSSEIENKIYVKKLIPKIIVYFLCLLNNKFTSTNMFSFSSLKMFNFSI